ncbi:ABC transporter ATP-binding protein [Achromobacter anxifer]|uniref:ABC transporter ATP-binding protein n=1 Tax=Achromobacter anxifer TaxID=1287737 RepID=UPI0021587BFA|nr:ABC transporter ATP-binding protein [Achromobacter anxifer]
MDATIVRAGMPAEPLLSVRGLHTRFYKDDTVIHAVNGMSLDLWPGEVLGVVGESGCGKSVTALSILRLIPRAAGRVVDGEIRFEGRDLLALSPRELAEVRGRDISMIFQEPMTSLNPVLRIGDQVAETLQLHKGMSRRAAWDRAVELLERVRIADPARQAREYPHRLSGGMRQRVMIAMALACSPRLMIADEPTTALDVTVQAQILELMADLNRQTGAAMMLITHDLGVVAEMAHRVIVMYAGNTVEEAKVEELFANPLHPYTRGLMAAIPRRGAWRDSAAPQALQEIPGMVPSLRAPVVGCAFAPRCAHATARCATQAPPMQTRANGHAVACWEADHMEQLGRPA